MQDLWNILYLSLTSRNIAANGYAACCSDYRTGILKRNQQFMSVFLEFDEKIVFLLFME